MPAGPGFEPSDLDSGQPCARVVAVPGWPGSGAGAAVPDRAAGVAGDGQVPPAGGPGGQQGGEAAAGAGVQRPVPGGVAGLAGQAEPGGQRDSEVDRPGQSRRERRAAAGSRPAAGRPAATAGPGPWPAGPAAAVSIAGAILIAVTAAGAVLVAVAGVVAVAVPAAGAVLVAVAGVVIVAIRAAGAVAVAVAAGGSPLPSALPGLWPPLSRLPVPSSSRLPVSWLSPGWALPSWSGLHAPWPELSPAPAPPIAPGPAAPPAESGLAWPPP